MTGHLDSVGLLLLQRYLVKPTHTLSVSILRKPTLLRKEKKKDDFSVLNNLDSCELYLKLAVVISENFFFMEFHAKMDRN